MRPFCCTNTARPGDCWEVTLEKIACTSAFAALSFDFALQVTRTDPIISSVARTVVSLGVGESLFSTGLHGFWQGVRSVKTIIEIQIYTTYLEPNDCVKRSGVSGEAIIASEDVITVCNSSRHCRVAGRRNLLGQRGRIFPGALLHTVAVRPSGSEFGLHKGMNRFLHRFVVRLTIRFQEHSVTQLQPDRERQERVFSQQSRQC